MLHTQEYLKLLYRTYANHDTEESACTDRYEQDVADQIVANAQIALRKYAFFRYSLWVDIVGLLASLGAASVIHLCV